MMVHLTDRQQKIMHHLKMILISAQNAHELLEFENKYVTSPEVFEEEVLAVKIKRIEAEIRDARALLDAGEPKEV